MNGLGVDQAGGHVSLFTSSIVVATICGRALEHRHFRPHADQPSGAPYNYCHQFQSGPSLNALLSQHLKWFSNHLSLASEPPDPVLIFVALVAHMAVFLLSEPGPESSCQGSDQGATRGTDGLSAEQKPRSLDIVHRTGTLTAMLGQLNHFRVCQPSSSLSHFPPSPFNPRCCRRLCTAGED